MDQINLQELQQKNERDANTTSLFLALSIALSIWALFQESFAYFVFSSLIFIFSMVKLRAYLKSKDIELSLVDALDLEDDKKDQN